MASNNSFRYCYNKDGNNNNLIDHIVSTKDAKKYLKPNINVLIK